MQLFHKHIKPEMCFACRNSFIYGGGGGAGRPQEFFKTGWGKNTWIDKRAFLGASKVMNVNLWVFSTETACGVTVSL